jgi:hypothetical protein
MPQQWKEHWELPENVTVERRNNLVQTIGNLTLLTKQLNPTVSNSAWEIKRPMILQNTVLQMNNQFYDVAEWTEETIEQRTQELFDLAVTIWPRPLQD